MGRPSKDAGRKANDDAIARHIGALVKRRRVERQMTQEYLAWVLGVSPRQIHKYENGLIPIRATEVPILAKLLAVPPSFFFDEIEITLVVDEGAGSQADGAHERSPA